MAVTAMNYGDDSNNKKSNGKLLKHDTSESDTKKKLKLESEWLKKLDKDIAKAREKLNQNLSATEYAETLANLQKLLDERTTYAKSITDLEALLSAENELKRQEQRKKNLENLKEAFSEDNLVSTAVDLISSSLSNLTTTLDTTMETFLNNLASIAYNLNGTGNTFKSVILDMTSAINGSGIVKELSVYENIKLLAEAGITFDIESRAYLMSLSDEIGMKFDMTSLSLNRLINLLREDLSDNRMAIEASLLTFLNLNYQTSQYIKEGFLSVSEALIESQSLMSANEATAYEAAIQKWLGSLSSVGMSTETINNIATAINNISSGNISDLVGTDMMKLMTLSANKAGLSIGTLLTENMTSTTVNLLMQGVVTLVTDMVGSASNNVVKSELARTLGINVSDVTAAENLELYGHGNGGVYDDINSALLDKMDNYIYVTTQILNALDNFVYTWATNIASDLTYYAIYKATEVVSNLAAAVLDGTEATIGIGVELTTDLGQVARLVPLVAALPALVSSGISSIGNLVTGSTGASSIYQALGGSQSMHVSSAGNLSGYTSGSSTSGSAVISNENTSDIGQEAYLSSTTEASNIVEPDTTSKTADDIYSLLTSDESWWARLDVDDIDVTLNDQKYVIDLINTLLQSTDWNVTVLLQNIYDRLYDKTSIQTMYDDFLLEIQTDSSNINANLSSALTYLTGIYNSLIDSDTSIASLVSQEISATLNLSSSFDSSMSSMASTISTSNSNNNNSSLLTSIYNKIPTAADIANAIASKVLISSGSGSSTVTTSGTSSPFTSTNVSYIQDAMTVAALNLQNIYNILAVWYNSTSDDNYSHYNTAGLTGLTNTLLNSYSGSLYLGGTKSVSNANYTYRLNNSVANDLYISS